MSNEKYITLPIKEEGQELIRKAAPIALSELSNILVTFIDLLIIAPLGTVSFAAVGLAGNLISNFLVVAVAFLSVSSVLISEDDTNLRRLARVRQVSLHCTCLLAIIIVPITYYLPLLLSYTGQDSFVIEAMKSYSRIMAVGVIFSLLSGWQRVSLTGLGVTFPIFLISFASIPLSVILSLIFVYGYAGFPQMGVAGAAVSFVIVSFLECVAYQIALILVKKRIDSEGSPDDTCHSATTVTLPKYLGFGSLQAAAAFAELGMFGVAAILVGTFSATALSAHFAVLAVLDIAYVVPFAIGEISAVQVSRYVSSEDRRRLTATIRAALAAVLVFSLLVSLGFIIFAPWLSAVFMPESAGDPGAFQTLQMMLLIAALFQIADGLQTVIRRQLRGFQDSAIPFIITVLGYWVAGLGLGAVIAFTTDEPTGLWWGLAIGLGLAAALMWLRLKTFTSQQLQTP